MDCSEIFKSKKVVFAFHGAELGGAEKQGLLLARYLRQEYGADVTVLGLMVNEPGKVADLCKQEGLEWLSFPLNWVNGNRRNRFGGMFRLVRTLRQMDADFILSYTVFPNIICSLVWRFTKAEMCIWNQRDEGLRLDDSFWCRTAVKLTSKFISNSNHGREFLQRKYKVADGRIFVLHNGVDLARPKLNRSEWRKHYGIDDRQLVACMVANLHHFKDHATLLRAWQLVVKQPPSGAQTPKLLLAGRLDDSAHHLKQLVCQLKLEDHVVFLGKIDDVAGLLAASDLYVHSSMHEGMPNAVLEAMKMGLPVVATDIPGIQDAVGSEGAHFLAAPQNPEALAELVIRFVADTNLRDQVGSQMKKRCDECFDPGVVLRQTVNTIIGSGNES